MKREQFFLNRERDVRLKCYQWKPENPSRVKAVIQLAHGMAEHILRYEAFAAHLTSQGYIVYGHDHRGHGESIMAPDDQGFFADENGFEKVVDDMHAISTMIQTEHPDLPFILFGHSMGSFLARRYIQLYGKEIDGVILSGTGGSQGIAGKAGQLIAAMEVRRIGRRTPSKLMDKLTFGGFNNNFEPARTAFDFLTRDEEVIDHYTADEKCGFVCSAQFYKDLLFGIDVIHQKKEIALIPHSLPMYLVSGELDPVGDNGKGVQNVYQQYKAAGLLHVDLTLYPNARHEILNELNKEEVYADITSWIEKTISI